MQCICRTQHSVRLWRLNDVEWRVISLYVRPQPPDIFSESNPNRLPGAAAPNLECFLFDSSEHALEYDGVKRQHTVPVGQPKQASRTK